MSKLSIVNGWNLLGWWKRFSFIPGGKWLFAKLVGLIVPYTGSMSFRINELGVKGISLTLRNKRKHYNHIGTVHAVAMSNLIELTGNLNMIAITNAETPFMLTGLEVSFLKKARGELTATCSEFEISSNHASMSLSVKDPDGIEVATGICFWKVW